MSLDNSRTLVVEDDISDPYGLSAVSDYETHWGISRTEDFWIIVAIMERRW
jgi:hypothetical protein